MLFPITIRQSYFRGFAEGVQRRDGTGSFRADGLWPAVELLRRLLKRVLLLWLLWKIPILIFYNDVPVNRPQFIKSLVTIFK